MKFPFCCFSSTSAAAPTNGSRLGQQTHENLRLFSYDELKIATDNFSASNKIGEGGFGSVYKGFLQDGTVVAVKVLSVELESMQGEREFVSELAVFSNIKHENLITLQGCCVEETYRLIVYDYMENNSLAHTLLGGEQNRMKFSWQVRQKILIGVARGLAYLHEEVTPHIVHRDIKASNILLDRDFTPKVSDFGLSRLLRDNHSYISTRVAGTLGYLAPEYAITGHLTRKSDVYSFGVLLMETISGQSVVNFDLLEGQKYLVQLAWEAYQASDLARLIDPMPGLNLSKGEEEAVRFLMLGLLCVQETARLRPSMSTAVKMMTNEIDIRDFKISQPGLVADLMKIKLGSKTSSSKSSITTATNTSYF
ncbi:hypothetical protein HS088_TW13G00462 [Tripterygium wilfordii]|uniref:Protein kinase domain-containing protein n=2 Tax=Tripterygium wilfordii TaxID=458696 RepID=A0A7J7CU10_TRIWF|nr:hypothetical protein HS088_TW13G00462 [Tripterygium wilfordii]